MAAAEQKRYPQAFLAQGNGDFMSCTNFSIKTTTNAKQIHTLREKGSGFTLGRTETTISADMVVSEDGPERNFYRDLLQGKPIQIRAKIPGGDVVTVNGVYSSVDLDAPLDDAVKISLSLVGKQEAA